VQNAIRRLAAGIATTLKFKTPTLKNKTRSLKNKSKKYNKEKKAEEKKKEKDSASAVVSSITGKKQDVVWNAITHAFQMKSTTRVGVIKNFVTGQVEPGKWGYDQQGEFITNPASPKELIAFGIWSRAEERQPVQSPKTIEDTFQYFRALTSTLKHFSAAALSIRNGVLATDYQSSLTPPAISGTETETETETTGAVSEPPKPNPDVEKTFNQLASKKLRRTD